MIHIMFCFGGDLHDSHRVLCFWIHMIHFVFLCSWIHIMFCFLGGNLHDSHCVLCFWIHMIHFVFCVVGFTRFTLCFRIP